MLEETTWELLMGRERSIVHCSNAVSKITFLDAGKVWASETLAQPCQICTQSK